jgi:hypothetical protein
MDGKLTIVASDAMECAAGKDVFQRRYGLITGRIAHGAELRPDFQATLCPKLRSRQNSPREAAPSKALSASA